MDCAENLVSDISTSVALRSDFRDDFEDHCIEISDLDEEQTTEEDVAAICSQCGDLDEINMSQKSHGPFFGTFWSLRSAYLMIRSTVPVRGFKWPTSND
jgi:hypothetical protein